MYTNAQRVRRTGLPAVRFVPWRSTNHAENNLYVTERLLCGVHWQTVHFRWSGPANTHHWLLCGQSTIQKKLNLRFLAANPSSPILCKLIEVLVESYILCNSLHQHLCKICPYKNCLAQTLQRILSSAIAPGYFGSITSKAFMKSILNNLYQHLALNKICNILFQTVLCAYIQHGSFCFTS